MLKELKLLKEHYTRLFSLVGADFTVKADDAYSVNVVIDAKSNGVCGIVTGDLDFLKEYLNRKFNILKSKVS